MYTVFEPSQPQETVFPAVPGLWRVLAEKIPLRDRPTRTAKHCCFLSHYMLENKELFVLIYPTNIHSPCLKKGCVRCSGQQRIEDLTTRGLTIRMFITLHHVKFGGRTASEWVNSLAQKHQGSSLVILQLFTHSPKICCRSGLMCHKQSSEREKGDIPFLCPSIRRPLCLTGQNWHNLPMPQQSLGKTRPPRLTYTNEDSPSEAG